jgi:hypothetical protein
MTTDERPRRVKLIIGCFAIGLIAASTPFWVPRSIHYFKLRRAYADSERLAIDLITPSERYVDWEIPPDRDIPNYKYNINSHWQEYLDDEINPWGEKYLVTRHVNLRPHRQRLAEVRSWGFIDGYDRTLIRVRAAVDPCNPDTVHVDWYDEWPLTRRRVIRLRDRKRCVEEDRLVDEREAPYWEHKPSGAHVRRVPKGGEEVELSFLQASGRLGPNKLLLEQRPSQIQVDDLFDPINENRDRFRRSLRPGSLRW